MSMKPPPVVSHSSATRELSVSSVASSSRGNTSPLRNREGDRSTPRRARPSWSSTTSPLSCCAVALSAVPGTNRSPVLVAEGPRLHEEPGSSAIRLVSPDCNISTPQRQASPVRPFSETRPRSPLRPLGWPAPTATEATLGAVTVQKSPQQSPTATEAALAAVIGQRPSRHSELGSEFALAMKETTTSVSSAKEEQSTRNDHEAPQGASHTEQDIQGLMKGALAAIMERQTEKTVAALQALIDRRLEEMAKRILQVEERSSQGLAALHYDIEKSRSSEVFQELLDQLDKDLAFRIDQTAEHWSRNLQLERQARQDSLAACERDMVRLREDVNVSILPSSMPAIALQELDDATEKCSRQVAQLVGRVDRIEGQLEAQRQNSFDKSAATALTAIVSEEVGQTAALAKRVDGIEEKISMGFAVEQHERRALHFELERAETQFAQAWGKERDEATTVFQQGVSQLQSVLASVSKGEKDRIDSWMVQQEVASKLNEMQHAVARLEASMPNHGSTDPQFTLSSSTSEKVLLLEERLEDVVSSLHVAEERWKSSRRFSEECGERQNTLSEALNAVCHEMVNLRAQGGCQPDYRSELRILDESIHAREARWSESCRSELSIMLRMVEGQEESLAACAAKDSEQMQAMASELGELRLNQESLAECNYEDPLSPQAQIKMREIVFQYTNSLSDDLHSKFRALHARSDEVVQTCHKLCETVSRLEGDQLGSCEKRRADPEPEPELVDLRRLESRQQESRFALEELQQQIMEIRQHEMREREALLLSSEELLRNSSQDTKIDSQTIKELHVRLDAVSAESARCSDSQGLFNNELADMCRVLRDMNKKVCELSELSMSSQRSAGGNTKDGCISSRFQELVNRQSSASENPNSKLAGTPAPACTKQRGVPPLRLTHMSQ